MKFACCVTYVYHLHRGMTKLLVEYYSLESYVKNDGIIFPVMNNFLHERFVELIFLLLEYQFC